MTVEGDQFIHTMNLCLLKTVLWNRIICETSETVSEMLSHLMPSWLHLFMSFLRKTSKKRQTKNRSSENRALKRQHEKYNC